MERLKCETFLKITKTLLAPHLRAEVAQSNAVSPAPSTANVEKVEKDEKDEKDEIKIQKTEVFKSDAGPAVPNAAKNFITLKVSTTSPLTKRTLLAYVGIFEKMTWMTNFLLI